MGLPVTCWFLLCCCFAYRCSSGSGQVITPTNLSLVGCSLASSGCFSSVNSVNAVGVHFPHIKLKSINSCKPSGFVAVLVLLASDADTNPGPGCCKCPCSMCAKPVKNSDPAVLCNHCGYWCHNLCSSLSSLHYSLMQNTSNVSWVCPACGLPSFISSIWVVNRICVELFWHHAVNWWSQWQCCWACSLGM